jgi:hypothetical protein
MMIIDPQTASDFRTAHENEMRETQRVNRSCIVDGFSIEELHKAFDSVCDLTNWKYPVKAEIHPSLLQVTLRAIEFMTGTKGTVVSVNPETGRIGIEAPGYYAGPCN